MMAATSAKATATEGSLGSRSFLEEEGGRVRTKRSSGAVQRPVMVLLGRQGLAAELEDNGTDSALPAVTKTSDSTAS
jgi:hypothetical protein